ncbi:Serpin B6 [Araneus ventricosus]|uniref:Serpin B6 n=1 Tax=Araneus ventricosus TaxID=182803 RepID=A0A4Y2WJT4_ARAVE|nr:Serpin B6 [Araneus ventricosus]
MIAEASHRFALNLLRTLAAAGPGNVCVSPLSLCVALSMLRCGARGDTASEIAEVLGLGGISEQDLEASFGRLLSSSDQAASAYTLDCANAAVLRKDFPVNVDYKEVLEKSFRAKLIQEDFTEDLQAVVDRINKWVETKTRGMISQLLDSLDPNTVLVLLNAVYFKGAWRNQFPESATHPQVFYNTGVEANAKEVDMMHLKEEFGYAELQTYTALQLPYRGDAIAMLILLPNSLDGLEEMEKDLTPGFVRNFKEKMRKRKVRVSLPRFRIEYFKSLKETFQELGMRKAFEDGADLSGISDMADLSVSDVVHKAVVEVNEEGTVAAAATAVMIQCRMMIIEPEFTVDHPFLFTIYDTRNDANLFTGRIVEL